MREHKGEAKGLFNQWHRKKSIRDFDLWENKESGKAGNRRVGKSSRSVRGGVGRGPGARKSLKYLTALKMWFCRERPRLLRGGGCKRTGNGSRSPKESCEERNRELSETRRSGLIRKSPLGVLDGTNRRAGNYVQTGLGGL